MLDRGGDVSDQLKNDFQNAKKRNLHTWTLWRMKVNRSLVDAVLTGTEVKRVEPIGRYMNEQVPDPYHPTTNPKTLLTYSAAENSSTNLRRQYFYKYGIPRVKLAPNLDGTGSKRMGSLVSLSGDHISDLSPCSDNFPTEKWLRQPSDHLPVDQIYDRERKLQEYLTNRGMDKRSMPKMALTAAKAKQYGSNGGNGHYERLLRRPFVDPALS